MKHVAKVYTGSIDDKMKVVDKYREYYEVIYEKEKIFKKIIYLNGVTFVNGVQGTGKTYLVKSILANREVTPHVNNVFWLDKPIDIDFTLKFLKLKETIFEGLFLLFKNELKGDYLRKWQMLCEKDHFDIDKERFDFKPFEPYKYDIIVIDDVATNPAVSALIVYSTILRHLHCGMIFIGQSETIIAKKFRDLLSMYILFNNPDDKILKTSIRKEVKQLLSSRNSKREAVCVDLIEEDIYMITANNENESNDEKPLMSKKTDLENFKEMLDSIE